MQIVVDDLEGDAIAAFLQQHIDDMKAVSPPESKHALDIEGLKADNITFWTMYIKGEVIGCGALKRLNSTEGELKSMRTAAKYRGQGFASKILEHILQFARNEQLKCVYLETGSMSFFRPAQALYLKYGFSFCEPFADYKPDPNSVFMSLNI